MLRKPDHKTYRSLARDGRNRVAGCASVRDLCRWHVGRGRNGRFDSTIFEPLRNPGIFAQAQVVLGAVQWPNGADLAPDAMYDAIRERGVWVLD